ncbi:hypothetical protein [Trichloromonas sp.]|uniref:hypothetical protein n=1 Tax=Trichloromonas sp. TaxID=3069249 RepID=UPI003D81B92B
MKCSNLLWLLLVAGCAVEAPDWTRGQASSYPPGDFLTAVGVSRAREAAEEKARHELLETFRWQPAAGELSVAGVKIAEVWHDRELDAFYALAVIDRQSAGQPLAAALAAIERSILGQVAAAEAAGSSLQRWGHYLQAVSLATKRSELAASLRRINDDAKLPPVAYTQRQLAERRDQAAAGIGLEISLRNDRNDAVRLSLIKAFAERGLKLAPSFSAGLRIRGSVAAAEQSSGAPAVVASIEVDGEGAGGAKLAAIDERADSQAIGERLALRIVAAVTSLAQQKTL